jgi:di/tricarboxylate transporter
MTLEIGLLLLLLMGMAYVFFTEKLPIELTAFAGLVVLVMGGFIPVSAAFTGFSSPAVITMLSIFFVSTAILNTGLADRVGYGVHRLLGGQERLLVVAIMTVAGILSAFMNNIAATAVMLPAVASISRRTGVAPSRLFMPLSFGAILGGTTTLVGTPPNILAAELLQERGHQSFGLFDFLPVGGTLLLVGMVFFLLTGDRLLPRHAGAASVSARSDLVQVYQLHETFFSIRIPPGSPLDGQTLGDTALGSALGVQVVGILREGRGRPAPEAGSVLLGGDVLLVQGSAGNVRELFRVRGAEFTEARPSDLAEDSERVTGVSARVGQGSPLVGRTLRELRFRERFGGVVMGVRRGEASIDRGLATLTLEEEDELLVLGPRAGLDEAALEHHFHVTTLDRKRFRALLEQLHVIRVPEDSGLVDRTIGESRIRELVGLTIGGILRGDETIVGIDPEEQIRAGDRLLVAGEVERLQSLIALGAVEIQPAAGTSALESDGIGLVEATLAPRSRSAGRTLMDLRFRERTGLQVLAVWREGELIHEDLARMPLRFGDALLLHGPWKRIRLLASDRDFVVLSESAREERRTKKAPFALGALLLMVLLVVTGFQPIHVAAFTAATLVVLTGAITMEEAYRGVEWRAVFLVAAILPVGVAMESTGAASLLSEAVTRHAGPHGPYAVLAGLVLLASLLSQALDGAPAVVLLTPVALTAADSLGINSRTVMMAISLAASAAFMTPFSHKANLLVMGAGGYRVADYLRVGTPLTVVVLALITLLVPVFFPF